MELLAQMTPRIRPEATPAEARPLAAWQGSTAAPRLRAAYQLDAPEAAGWAVAAQTTPAPQAQHRTKLEELELAAPREVLAGDSRRAAGIAAALREESTLALP